MIVIIMMLMMHAEHAPKLQDFELAPALLTTKQRCNHFHRYSKHADSEWHTTRAQWVYTEAENSCLNWNCEGLGTHLEMRHSRNVHMKII